MLYVVATPIGNLKDISPRAVEVLREVDLIAAEDTRHSRRLLDECGISTKVIAFHDHNESQSTQHLVHKLQGGASIALISDAGTPLISDPGYRLVRAALDAGVPVSPIPGPSAVLSALSVSGLPTDRFCFEGFLPAKQKQRLARLEDLAKEPRTLVFFEAPHRIDALMADVAEVLGAAREVTVCRELTKQFEQIWSGCAADAIRALGDGTIVGRGEFVLVVRGAASDAIAVDESRLMKILLAEMSPAQAASIASQVLGKPRKQLYELALSMKSE